MTATFEPLTQPAGKPAKRAPLKAAPRETSFTVAILAVLSGSAIASGLSGLALHRGFGVSVPFMAGWFLILGFLFFLRMAVLTAAGAWFNVAIQAAPKLAEASVAGAAIAEQEVEDLLNAMALLDMDSKLRGK